MDERFHPLHPPLDQRKVQPIPVRVKGRALPNGLFTRDCGESALGNSPLLSPIRRRSDARLLFRSASDHIGWMFFVERKTLFIDASNDFPEALFMGHS